MTYFLKSGTSYRVSTKESMDLHETLPAGNYVIKADMMGNLYLESIESFEIPSKLYGDTLKHTDRILRTFKSRDASTGVMLNGEKGSGKTLLAKNLSYQAAKEGIPTIVINSAWHGDKFNALIQSIEQPCIVLFDEYEKVYASEEQEAMLTLLDGVFPSKKLFVLTCNDKWRVNEHMRNRPGRIFYLLDFKGLGAEFIREYCEDRLNNKEHIERIVQIAGTFGEFNFDMLKATVEEMNRYNESPQEALAMLNAKPEYGVECKYKTTLVVDGEQIEGKRLDGNDEWSGNPLGKAVRISYYKVETDKDGDEDWDYNIALFKPNDLKKIGGDGSTYTFINAAGHTLVLNKVKERSYNYYDAF